jgi:hypothetical protein
VRENRKKIVRKMAMSRVAAGFYRKKERGKDAEEAETTLPHDRVSKSYGQ